MHDDHTAHKLMSALDDDSLDLAWALHDIAYYAALAETGRSREGKDAASRIAACVFQSVADPARMARLMVGA